MIPHFISVTDSLPLTPNGKVDRHALEHGPAPTPDSNSTPLAPHTAKESQLSQIFRKVLNTEHVGTQQNFFDLGGDSLSALSVIFSAEQLGLSLTVDMLRSMNIQELALTEVARRPSHAPAPTSPPVPLVPSQLWLLERSLANPAAYAVALWLQSKTRIDHPAITRAWQATVDHHDALRITLTNHQGRLCQQSHPRGSKVAVEFADLTQTPADQLPTELQSLANKIVASTNLNSTPLARLLCVRLPDADDLLFLFVPHLLIDEYSASIVIDDLAAAYVAALSSQPGSLPPTTAPFALWANHLSANASHADLHHDYESFRRLPWSQAGRLPNADQPNNYANSRDLLTNLTPPETLALIHTARDLRLPLECLLIAALAHSVGHWANIDDVPLDITSTGRDPLFDSPPLHRSVGFFSSIHPVLLQNARIPLTPSTLHDVNAALHSAPSRGVRYGMMHYLHPDPTIRHQLAALPRPQIKFNYHGVQPFCPPDCLFQPAPIPPPFTLNGTDQRHYLLNLEITYDEDRLKFAWKYPGTAYSPTTMLGLTEQCLRLLRDFAEVADS